MTSIDGFPYHFFLFLIPHRVIQHFFQHTQCPQFSGAYIAQKGAVVVAVGPPVFLLPAGVAGGTVDELIQFLWIVYAIVQRVVVLKTAMIFPGGLATGDARRAQIRNILHGEKGRCIEDMCSLAAAVADNALLGFLKGPGIQRVRMILESGQAQLK